MIRLNIAAVRRCVADALPDGALYDSERAPGVVRLRLHSKAARDAVVLAVAAGGYYVADDPRGEHRLLVALEKRHAELAAMTVRETLMPAPAAPEPAPEPAPQREPIRAREVRPQNVIHWQGEPVTVRSVGAHDGMIVLALPGRTLRTAPSTPMWRELVVAGG